MLAHAAKVSNPKPIPMAAATSIAAAMMKPNMIAIFLAMSLYAVLHVDAILYFFGRSVVVERQMSNVEVEMTKLTKIPKMVMPRVTSWRIRMDIIWSFLQFSMADLIHRD